MNIVDIILIAVIAVVAIISAKKGFMMTLFNIAAYAIAGIFSKLFSTPVAEYAYTNFFNEIIIGKLYEIMPSGSVEGEINTVLDNTIESLPGYMQALINHFGVADVSGVMEQTGVDTLTVEVIEQTYLAPAVTNILSIVAMVILFVLLGFLLRIVFSFINRIFTRKKHKFIRSTNMILGAAFGALKGVLIAAVIAAVLNIGVPVINNPELTEFVNTSAICNMVAEILK